MIKSSVRSIAYNAGEDVLLPENPKRIGLIIENDTNTSLFLSYNDRRPTSTDRSMSLPAKGQYEQLLPIQQMYKGIIRFALANANSGYIFVTEFWEQ